MMKSVLKSRTLLLAATLCTALGANAKSCYEKSPNFKTQGDDYFVITRSSGPSAADVNAMSKYFEGLEGDWAGTAVVTECFGSSREPEERPHDAEIDAKVAAGTKGSLNVDYEIYHIEDKKRKLQKIRLDSSENNQIFSVGTDDVTASEKFRLRNKNGSTRLVERIVRVSGKGEKLGLELSTYVNGYLSKFENWELKK